MAPNIRLTLASASALSWASVSSVWAKKRCSISSKIS
jgi:hypothetical protein